MDYEYVHRWDSPESQYDSALSTVRSTPEQLLTGLPIGTPSPEASCTACNRAVREGEAVVVYAYRMPDAESWDLARCYCRDCRADEIATPTLCASEVLAEAVLGRVADARRQTHQFCLLDVEPTDTSPPGEGTKP